MVFVCWSLFWVTVHYTLMFGNGFNNIFAIVVASTVATAKNWCRGGRCRNRGSGSDCNGCCGYNGGRQTVIITVDDTAIPISRTGEWCASRVTWLDTEFTRRSSCRRYGCHTSRIAIHFALTLSNESISRIATIITDIETSIRYSRSR